MNFKNNPFWLLEASPRDSKRVLHDKAENKAFEVSEDVCRNAENILISPKKRLEAELSWFPGLSPKRIKDTLGQIITDAESHVYNADLFCQFDNLARANALAFFLSNVSDSGSWTKNDITKIVSDFCEAASNLEPDSVLRPVNEDRVASGFPEVSFDDGVASAINDLVHEYKNVLHSFLDLQDSCVIVDALTGLVEDNTDYGEHECGWPLLDSIISDYELDATPFFDKQEAKIESDIGAITQDLELEKEWAQIQNKFDTLRRDILLWDRVAQPIQVLLRSKGVEHRRSELLSRRLREFALIAHNQHGYTELSIKLTELQQSVFAELRIA